MSKKEISRQFDGNSGAITNAPDNDKIKGAAVPAESPDAAAGEAGEEKPVFNQIAYQNEYNRQKYDRVNLTMPKGRKEKIRLAAAARGQSVNEFINAAILAAMEAGGETTVTPIEEAGAAE